MPDGWPVQAAQVVFLAVCSFGVYRTIGRGMPVDGRYQIGPRQMVSALLLGGMFWFQFLSLQRVWAVPTDRNWSLTVPALLTQLYCLTLLYLQTELFKKSAMQKEMQALNLLYDRQRQQYRVARQNVQIINRKCHELKVQIADLRRLHPDAGMEKSQEAPEQAMIDLLLYARQGFAVLNLVGPADSGAGAPNARYEFKVVRRIAQKYNGTATAETREGFDALKVLIPLPDAS